jgi:hypothetical protein
VQEMGLARRQICAVKAVALKARDGRAGRAIAYDGPRFSPLPHMRGGEGESEIYAIALGRGYRHS